MVRGRSGRAGSLAAIAAAIGLALASAPAVAGDANLGTANGVTYIRDQEPIAIGQPAAAAADCPAGTELYGIGADAVSTQLGGILSSLRPEDGGDANSKPDDGATVFAHNTTGIGGDTRVHAMCGPGKVRYPSRTAMLRLGDTKTAKISCPAGTRVLSGGVYLDGSNSDVHLHALLPFDDGDGNSRPDDGWKVKASNLGGAKKQFTAWAFCREDIRPVYPDLGSLTGVNAGNPAGAGGACPDQTTSLMGGAGQIRGQPNTRRITGLEPSDNTSKTEPDTVPDDTLVTQVENNSASEAEYGSHPICAAVAP